jgi:hypothetical protein
MVLVVLLLALSRYITLLQYPCRAGRKSESVLELELDFYSKIV